MSNDIAMEYVMRAFNRMFDPVTRDLAEHIRELDRQDAVESRIEAAELRMLDDITAGRGEAAEDFGDAFLDTRKAAAQLIAAVLRNDPQEMRSVREQIWTYAMDWTKRNAKEAV